MCPEPRCPTSGDRPPASPVASVTPTAMTQRSPFSRWDRLPACHALPGGAQIASEKKSRSVSACLYGLPRVSLSCGWCPHLRVPCGLGDTHRHCPTEPGFSMGPYPGLVTYGPDIVHCACWRSLYCRSHSSSAVLALTVMMPRLLPRQPISSLQGVHHAAGPGARVNILRSTGTGTTAGTHP